MTDLLSQKCSQLDEMLWISFLHQWIISAIICLDYLPWSFGPLGVVDIIRVFLLFGEHTELLIRLLLKLPNDAWCIMMTSFITQELLWESLYNKQQPNASSILGMSSWSLLCSIWHEKKERCDNCPITYEPVRRYTMYGRFLNALFLEKHLNSALEVCT